MISRFKHKFISVIWALSQLIQAALLETVLLFILILFQGVLPASSLLIISKVVNCIGSESVAFHGLVLLITAWGAILFMDTALGPFISIIRVQLNEKVLAHSNLLLMEKTNSIQGLKPFEDRKLYDEIQFLKDESRNRPLNFVYIITGFFRDFITLCSVLVLMATIDWWMPLLIVFAGIPHALSSLWFEKQAWDQLLFKSPELRRMHWFSSLTMDEKASKEIRFFGFGNFLVDRFKYLAKVYHQSLGKERWKKSLACIAFSTLSVAGNIGIFTFIVLKAAQGILSLGHLVVAIQALVIVQLQLTGCIANFGMLMPALLFFGKFRNFLQSNLCDLHSKSTYKNLPDVFPNKEISFENVSFFYPDGRKALSNVSFTINSKDKIGIVGENGAGKSTIIKLLARFYEPSKGRITIDGIDLKEIDVEAWRKCLSGVFQDFGQYQLTAKENVLLSQLNAQDEEISRACNQGGFSPTIPNLPKGLDSLIGKEFGGTSLSGGEWQKLALSRALLRESHVLILDEPTSALDPRSEHEIFNRFSQYSEGRTTIMVTHRLGSVKMVDRLLVLKNGYLVEEGTHNELISLNGEYAQLFNLQAENYSIHDEILS